MADAASMLTSARCRLITREPWYGHMAMSMEWHESDMAWITDESKRTFGIKITSEGAIQCMYYAKWVETMSLEKLYGAIEHVINHLVHLHTIRRFNRNPEAWAIATDMVVNGTASKPRIGYTEDDSAVMLPFDNMIFIPKDWPENETADFYYDKMVKEEEDENGGGGKGKGKGQGQGQGEGEGEGEGDGDGDGDGQGQGQGQGKGKGQGQGKGKGQGGGNGPKYEYGKHSGTGVDDHDIWSQTDVSEDEARQLINERARDASEKSQGREPGHLKDALDKLKKPVVRWREMLRSFLGRHVGNRRKTYSRPDRRQNAFGTKGISHRAACDVTVIVDTSGSIGKAELEQFFAEIDAIAARAAIWVIQWDAALQGAGKYRKGDWKKFEIHGGGGTDMAAPVTYAEKNGMLGDVMVMLTDGFCNWPSPRNIPAVFCITTPPSSSTAPEWGTSIRLKVSE